MQRNRYWSVTCLGSKNILSLYREHSFALRKLAVSFIAQALTHDFFDNDNTSKLRLAYRTQEHSPRTGYLVNFVGPVHRAAAPSDASTEHTVLSSQKIILSAGKLFRHTLSHRIFIGKSTHSVRTCSAATFLIKINNREAPFMAPLQNSIIAGSLSRLALFPSCAHVYTPITSEHKVLRACPRCKLQLFLHGPTNSVHAKNKSRDETTVASLKRFCY